MALQCGESIIALVGKGWNLRSCESGSKQSSATTGLAAICSSMFVDCTSADLSCPFLPRKPSQLQINQRNCSVLDTDEYKSIHFESITFGEIDSCSSGSVGYILTETPNDDFQALLSSQSDCEKLGISTHNYEKDLSLQTDDDLFCLISCSEYSWQDPWDQFVVKADQLSPSDHKSSKLLTQDIVSYGSMEPESETSVDDWSLLHVYQLHDQERKHAHHRRLSPQEQIKSSSTTHVVCNNSHLPSEFNMVDSLLKCAEALVVGEVHLAREELARLKEILPSLQSMPSLQSVRERAMSTQDVSHGVKRLRWSNKQRELQPTQSTISQRATAYVSEGLHCVLCGGDSPSERLLATTQELKVAYHILHESLPLIRFGHFAANQAILEVVERESSVHIIDFEIMDGIQWPALMQAFALRKGGPPRLTITAVCHHQSNVGSTLLSNWQIGRQLEKVAASFSIPFLFELADTDWEHLPRLLTQSVKAGEALVANCMLHLPHAPTRSMQSVFSFAREMRRSSAKILTLVEEPPTLSKTSFGRLLHTLEHNCNLLRILETKANSGPVLEHIFIAPKIKSAVISSFQLRQGQAAPFSKIRSYSDIVMAAGFKMLPLSGYNLHQSRMMLHLCSDGYHVQKSGDGLVLDWNSRVMASFSAWTSLP
ncbi:hypothetical protein O6H91_04G004200 [Diphasiastrum complanatum]|uniref:Uncharacterized protein n=1 Tax=Diphasiastrum complanatum TaxID=34168 RepID=A0ACC2DTL6_DIPCM|nr:hypothetical protein O6H91_Y058000 [Diphasiastrum complanatum]KAJ7557654.1 hypothetical protein O6H91_04G004200 [Diphasiastrum complanatum]